MTYSFVAPPAFDAWQGPWGLTDVLSNARIEKTLRSHTRTTAARTVLKLEGDGSPVTYCMLSGWLAVSKSMENGQRQIIDFLLPGDILDPSSADANISALQIEAVTPVRIAAVPNAVWRALAAEAPELQRIEVRTIAATFSRLSERMLRLGRGSAEARVAYALIELCIRLGAFEHGDDCQFSLPLTQQQLGEFIGLSSVHVCRTMRRMCRNGLITMQGHMDITIGDMAGLSDIAGIDPHTLRVEIIPH